MMKILMTAMTTSISEVMETMFFLPVEIGSERVIEKSGIEKDKSIACQLAFTGDTSGKLIIISPTELTAAMAENFMGEARDDLTQEHLSGILTEMLNMVCGNALGRIKSKVPYEVGIPEVVSHSNLDDTAECTIIETINSKMAVMLILDES